MAEEETIATNMGDEAFIAHTRLPAGGCRTGYTCKLASRDAPRMRVCVGNGSAPNGTRSPAFPEVGQFLQSGRYGISNVATSAGREICVRNWMVLGE